MGRLELRYPVDYITIVQPYKPASHWGMDLGYGASTGPNLPICAAADGEVISVVDGRGNSAGGGWGNRVQIYHGNGFYTLYAHLKSGSLLVKKGDRVTRGQQIARMGNSGNSYGPHLHFELYEGGTEYTNPNYRIDPAPYLFVFPGQEISSRNDYPELIQYHEEEEDVLTQEKFEAMYQKMLESNREKEQSEWSRLEGHWDKAVAIGVFDGTAPQNPMTRQEAAAVLGRLGQFGKGGADDAV